jgi:hypothetical protein
MQIYLQKALDDNKIEGEMNGFQKVFFQKSNEYWVIQIMRILV